MWQDLSFYVAGDLRNEMLVIAFLHVVVAGIRNEESRVSDKSVHVFIRTSEYKLLTPANQNLIC